MLRQNETKYKSGDTSLHLAVRKCTSYDDFIKLIKNISLREQIDNSLTVNNKGKLPFDILIKRDLSTKDFDKIFSHLIKTALKRKIKPINELIDFHEILNQYQLEPNSELYKQLEVACELMNTVRTHMTKRLSTTHPTINAMDTLISETLNAELEKNRARKKNRSIKELIKNGKFTDDSTEDSELVIRIEIPKKSAKVLHQYQADLYNSRIINCEEMSALTQDLGHKKNLKIISYCFHPGDHVFSTIADSTKTLENSVICDTWGGNIYFGSELDKKLGDYRTYTHHDKNYNFIVNYNPHYNKIHEKIYYKKNDNSLEYALEFNNNFVDQFVFKLIKNYSVVDKFLFAYSIKNKLSICIDENLLSKKTMLSWKDPDEMLKKYFATNDRYMPLIIFLYAKSATIFFDKICKALRHGVDPNQAMNNGMSAIFVAAQNNYLDVVEKLLEQPNIIMKSVRQDWTVFRDLAKTKKQRDAMEEHIINKITQGEEKSAITMTPLEVATIMGYHKIAFKLQTYLFKQFSSFTLFGEEKTVSKKPQETKQEENALSASLAKPND